MIVFFIYLNCFFPRKHQLFLVHFPTYFFEMSVIIHSRHTVTYWKSQHIKEKWLTLSLDLIIISRNRMKQATLDFFILLLRFSLSVGLTSISFGKGLFILHLNPCVQFTSLPFLVPLPFYPFLFSPSFPPSPPHHSS